MAAGPFGSSATRIARAALVGAVAVTATCARSMPRSVDVPSGQPDIAALWEGPHDLESRDLFHGPGGTTHVPSADAQYQLVAEDRSGYSRGYTVRGPDGTEWSVKLGPEAQPEIVTSRVLWAIGYHQPPTYYAPRWTLAGKVTTEQPAGRFRPRLPDREVVGEWSWYENEFASTKPFKGLLVANLLLNNWDWKTSNNKIYEIRGAAQPPRRLYVVQDLGASLGKTTFPAFLNWFPIRGLGQGTRNDLGGFESQRFIRRATPEGVHFDYRGIHKPLLDSVSIEDVTWACELLSRLSEAQLADAFRAAGYSDSHTRRYVAKIRSKIAEGLTVSGSAPVRSRSRLAPA